MPSSMLGELAGTFGDTSVNWRHELSIVQERLARAHTAAFERTRLSGTGGRLTHVISAL